MALGGVERGLSALPQAVARTEALSLPAFPFELNEPNPPGMPERQIDISYCGATKWLQRHRSSLNSGSRAHELQARYSSCSIRGRDLKYPT